MSRDRYVQLAAYVAPDLGAKIAAICEKETLSISSWLRLLVLKELKRLESEQSSESAPKLVEQGHDVYAVAPGGTPHEYTMRDHRHTWAVRAVRSGWPIDAVARQMGHIDGTLIMKVYGRFIPQQHERDRWEAMATARDAERKELNAETSAV